MRKTPVTHSVKVGDILCWQCVDRCLPSGRLEPILRKPGERCQRCDCCGEEREVYRVEIVGVCGGSKVRA